MVVSSKAAIQPRYGFNNPRFATCRWLGIGLALLILGLGQAGASRPGSANRTMESCRGPAQQASTLWNTWKRRMLASRPGRTTLAIVAIVSLCIAWPPITTQELLVSVLGDNRETSRHLPIFPAFAMAPSRGLPWWPRSGKMPRL